MEVELYNVQYISESIQYRIPLGLFIRSSYTLVVQVFCGTSFAKYKFHGFASAIWKFLAKAVANCDCQYSYPN